MSDLEDPGALNERGLALQDAGDTSGAEAAYRAALALAPQWSVPHYNLGLIAKYDGRWRESFDFNRRAAELAPDDQGAWWNTGIAATALGERTRRYAGPARARRG